jgi:cold shock CspA family protein
MGKSQQSWNKKEREKKKQKERKDKEEKMQERKDNSKAGKTLDDMLAWVDENGHIVSEPPDPGKMKKVKLEDIEIGVPAQRNNPADELPRSGKVSFFNDAKGFGFIKDSVTQESIFVHVNNVSGNIKENDKVSFEVEMGQRGPMALNVKIIA